MKRGLVRRLMLAYTAVIAAVLFSAWWTQRTLGDVERMASRLSERSVEGIELSARLETLIEEKNHVADYLATRDHDALPTIRPHRQEFATWLAAMQDFVRTDEERALLEGLRVEYAAYASAFDELIRVERSADGAETRGLFRAMTEHVQRLLADGRALARLAEQDMATRRSTADATMEHTQSVVLWLTGLGGLVSLLLGFVLSRFAARPIYQLVLRLGSSGMIDRIEVDGDELGALEAHVAALLARVRQQERALQQAEKLSELGEIASEIAHETLNPLAGVKGMLQALRRTPLPPERLPRELSDMERELNRVEGIVRRLVRYARPLEPRMRPVRIDAVLHDAVIAARRAPGARGRDVAIGATCGPRAWIMDPDLIQQVLVNLIVNGCEASPEGTIVEVDADVDDERLTFSVRDRGVGIAVADRDRLFLPFFTTKPNGNGLGLAVSRNIVREHGGTIDATLDVEGGTVFTVVLPDGEGLCAAPS